MSFCSKCGQKIESGSRFCPQCGTLVELSSPIVYPTSDFNSNNANRPIVHNERISENQYNEIYSQKSPKENGPSSKLTRFIEKCNKIGKTLLIIHSIMILIAIVVLFFMLLSFGVSLKTSALISGGAIILATVFNVFSDLDISLSRRMRERVWTTFLIVVGIAIFVFLVFIYYQNK